MFVPKVPKSCQKFAAADACCSMSCLFATLTHIIFCWAVLGVLFGTTMCSKISWYTMYTCMCVG